MRNLRKWFEIQRAKRKPPDPSYTAFVTPKIDFELFFGPMTPLVTGEEQQLQQQIRNSDYLHLM
jgi:hypothetical protein